MGVRESLHGSAQLFQVEPGSRPAAPGVSGGARSDDPNRLSRPTQEQALPSRVGGAAPPPPTGTALQVVLPSSPLSGWGLLRGRIAGHGVTGPPRPARAIMHYSMCEGIVPLQTCVARGDAPRSDLHGRPEQDRPVALEVHICAAILCTCHACVVVAI